MELVDVVALLQLLVAVIFLFKSEVQLSSDRYVKSPQTKIFALLTLVLIAVVYWSGTQPDWQSQILLGIMGFWILSLFFLADQRPR